MTSSPASRAPVIVHVVGMTDVGRTREHNEDAFLIADLSSDRTPADGDTHVVGERGAVFMVADGMGGAAAGELASQMATDIVLNELRARWRSAPENDGEHFALALRAAAETANARIHDYALTHPENRGMGSTATIAGLLGDTVYCAQVGDSRAYLVRDGRARQLTRDQSLVQRLIDAGEITAEEAEQSARKNIILQALGPDVSVKIVLTHQRVRRGDVLVLCSDGLSGQVRPDAIGAVAASEPNLQKAAQRLIDMANAAGGPDNITVVLARFDGEGLEAAPAGDEVGHHVFRTPIEGRPTIPMEPLAESAAMGESAYVPDTAVATSAALDPSSRAALSLSPEAPAPRGPGIATWRVIFGTVAVLALAYFIYRAFSR